MELERLKAAWNAQPIDGEFAGGEDRMIEQITKRMRTFHRKIFWRDVFETLAAILVATVFAVTARPGGTLMQVGAAVVIVAAVTIVIVLHTARKRTRRVDASLKHGLQSELEAVERQIKLLRNVLYWYIAPLFLGGFLWGLGLVTSIPAPEAASRGLLIAIGVTGQVAVLCGVGYFVWWMNRKAVREQLVPLRDRIARSLEAIPSRH